MTSNQRPQKASYGDKSIDSLNPSRRSFLSTTTTGGLSLAGIPAFLAARQSFGRSLRSVGKEMKQAATSDSKLQNDEFQDLAKKYLLDPKVNYLNHASIGTIARPVHEARRKYLDICETNPWLYMWGGAWEEDRKAVRKKCAQLLHANSDEIAITHNTTEAFNLMADGLPLKPNDEILFSTLCHAGASLPFVHRAKTGKYKTRKFDFPISLLPELKSEHVVDAYRKQIRPETRVLIIPHIDNTVGVRYPVKAIAKMARAEGVEFVALDAAQTVGMLPVDVSNLDVDLLATSPHKWLGAPKGIGLTYIRKSLHDQLRATWVTWGQDRWAGSARVYEDYGTRNLAELLTLGDAVDWNQAIDADKREQRLKSLWQYTRDLVNDNRTLDWNSPSDWAMSGSLYSIRVSKPADKLAQQIFADQGIVVRPFTNMGLNNLRVSPNVFTTTMQIDALVAAAAV